jgi:hypothetical protein
MLLQLLVSKHLNKRNVLLQVVYLARLNKYTADAIFDKFKSKIVAGGHLPDRDMYDNGLSPTVSTTSVYIVAAIAAKEDRAVATIDFPGAFLNSDMPLDGDHVVFVRINKYLTNVLTSLDPSYKKVVNANGTCVV